MWFYLHRYRTLFLCIKRYCDYIWKSTINSYTSTDNYNWNRFILKLLKSNDNDMNVSHASLAKLPSWSVFFFDLHLIHVNVSNILYTHLTYQFCNRAFKYLLFCWICVFSLKSLWLWHACVMSDKQVLNLALVNMDVPA